MEEDMSRFIASAQQDRDFALSIMPDVLEDAVDWISGNLSPEEVFSEKDLDDWAISYGYTKEERHE
jgi:hypothetical protein